MLFKNFIWDFDGTIIDTYPSTINSIIKTMKKYDVNLSYDVLYQKAKINLKEVFEYIKNSHGFDDNIIEEIIDNFSKIPHEDRIKYDKIEEVLKFIAEKKGNNFLVTHRDKKSTYDILDHYNLNNLFVKVVTSDNNFPLKPNPESFIYLIDKYNLNRINTVGIGDRKLDVGAAKNSNITSVFMNMDSIDIDYKADYVFNNYYDFYKNILMGWLNGYKKENI